MTSKRLFIIFLASLGLSFLLFAGGAYGLNKLLASKAAKLYDLKSKNIALDYQKIALSEAKKDIQNYAELEKIAKTIVPEDKSQAETVRQIVKIAAINGVSLGSISFPASTLGGNASGNSSAGSSTAPPVAGSKQSLSQLQPVKNIPGVYLLQIVVTSDTNKPVPFNKFVGFLTALEGNRRTAQVSNITLQPDAENKNNITFSLTLNQYIKPDSKAK